MTDMPEKIYLEKHDGELYFSGDTETEYTRSDKYEALNNEYVDLKSKYEALGRSHDRLVEDMQWFCDRVDKGEVRSKNTYNRFKQSLAEAEKVSGK